MDLTQLETLLAVVQHGSFTAAAEALRLTQPGVTRQIQRLELEIGVRLIERGRSGPQLTPEGQRFAVYARQTVEGYHATLRDLHGPKEELRGELRIGASTTPGEFLVPDLLSAFAADHPQVRPLVHIADTAGIVAELQGETYDLGFVGARLPGQGLRYEPIAQDEIVLAAPGDHPLASRDTISLADLEGQPFIERGRGSGTLRSVHQLLAKNGLQLPPHPVVMVLSNTEAVVSAVERGYGLGWVSSSALEHRDPSRIAGLRLKELALIRPLYLTYRTTGALSPVAEAFVLWAGRFARTKQG